MNVAGRRTKSTFSYQRLPIRQQQIYAVDWDMARELMTRLWRIPTGKENQ